jgi:uncharacterized protein involved in response to NO
MALIPLGEPVRRPPPGGFALWALGFRPFYLLAAAFAAIGMLAWLFVLTGRLAMPMPAVWWHAHEMLFGFAAAVIVGFLFTAGRNWTGLDTPTGTPLALLALLWLLGRVGMAFGGGIATAALDTAFLPAAAIAIARVLWQAGSRRNYFVVGILSLLAGANIAFHLGRIGALAIDPLQALHFALGVIVLLETVIGGRVIPSFTASALKGVRQWQSQPWNYASVAATGLALLAWALLPEARWPAALSLLAFVLQVPRCLGWNPWATRGAPLLWILHLAHLWIPVGLLLLAAAQFGWLPRSAGVHALTIGATGGLIIGMITRTALGHTGRMIIVGRVEVAAYALVQVAAVVRVLTVAAIPLAATAGIHIAATLWALAFLLYLWRYLPWLLRPRIDGQPG